MPLPHLLVIDDDAQARRVFQRLFSGSFVVSSVADGETALAMFEDGSLFDVILCDLHLPGMSGTELYDQVKRRSPVLAARVVILTGEAPAPGDAFARELGTRYLTKPFPTTELTAKLRGVASPPLAPLAAT